MQIIYDTSDTHGHNRISRLFPRGVTRVTKKGGEIKKRENEMELRERRKREASRCKSRRYNKFSRFCTLLRIPPGIVRISKDTYRKRINFHVIYGQLEIPGPPSSFRTSRPALNVISIFQRISIHRVLL